MALLELVSIESKIFSDHAVVGAYWKNKDIVYYSPIWHLDNFLLTEEKSRVQMEFVIKSFYETNARTADDMMVWQTFKVHKYEGNINFDELS